MRNEEHITVRSSGFNECRLDTEIVSGIHSNVFSSVTNPSNAVFVNEFGCFNILTNLTANSSIAMPMLSSLSSSTQIDKIQSSIVDEFFKNIFESLAEGKIQESIKDSYNAFDKILEVNNTDLADRILSVENIDKLPTPVIISFLNSTSKFKNNLKNRDLIFEKLKDKIVNELGEENFKKSLYARLK